MVPKVGGALLPQGPWGSCRWGAVSGEIEFICIFISVVQLQWKSQAVSLNVLRVGGLGKDPLMPPTPPTGGGYIYVVKFQVDDKTLICKYYKST